MSSQNFMAIHLIVVEMFQSGLKWIDGLTDVADNILIYRVMLLAWLKKREMCLNK